MKKFKSIVEDFKSELGNYPNFSNPQRMQSVKQHSSSKYGIDPEKAAAEHYKRLIDKVKRYTGSQNVNIGQLQMQMMQDLQDVMGVEKRNKNYLEQLAVKVVLDMDEFSFIKDIVNNGDLKIDAKLIDFGSMNIQQELEDFEQEEQQDPEASYSLAEVMFDDDEKKARRALANAISQGTALDSQYVFHLLEDELKRLSPKLVQQYGFLVSFATLLYYMMSPEMGGAMQGGQVNVDDEDEPGVYTIKARAVIFPVLIQEIIKGVYQYISMTSGLRGAEEGGLAQESDDIIVGSEINKQLRTLIDPKDSKYIIPVIQHMLIELDREEITNLFKSPKRNQIVQEIINFFKEQEREHEF